MAPEAARRSRALVLMVKVPRPGTCKTRLCPPLEPREAARLYTCFLRDLARELGAWRGDADLVIAWADEDRRQGGASHEGEPPPLLTQLFPSGATFLAQRGASLPERMSAVFSALFDRGYRTVVMRNSDSPHLPTSRLDDAFRALDAQPGGVVVGPDLDGGYYLIGADQPIDALLPDVMSTASVLEQTVARAAEAGRPVRLLEPFLDVDTPDDLAVFWLEFGSRADVRHWATWQELDGHPALERLIDAP